MVRYLFELRIHDPAAFDLLGLKILHPDATHNRLATIMRETTRSDWSEGSGRVRSYERLQRLVSEFPELADVVTFDRRGGNQQRGPVHPADMDREYRHLVRQEQRLPRGERRKSLGVGGLYHEVAMAYGVIGKGGGPSWNAARLRISRWRTEQARNLCYTAAKSVATRGGKQRQAVLSPSEGA